MIWKFVKNVLGQSDCRILKKFKEISKKMWSVSVIFCMLIEIQRRLMVISTTLGHKCCGQSGL